MINVGIQTILDYNFGNRLQNYALQETLKELGCNVETLNDVSTSCHIEKMKNMIKCLINKDYRMKAKASKKPYSKKRNKVISEWNQSNIRLSNFKFSRYHIPRNIGNMYDYFISGSDQVWNPYFRKDTLMLLSYAPEEKRISYAASFGVSKMPPEFYEKFSNELLKYKAISVREQAGVEIVDEICEKNAVCVIDPTMLLSIERWRTVESKPDWLGNGEFVVLYSVGGVFQRKLGNI